MIIHMNYTVPVVVEVEIVMEGDHIIHRVVVCDQMVTIDDDPFDDNEFEHVPEAFVSTVKEEARRYVDTDSQWPSWEFGW